LVNQAPFACHSHIVDERSPCATELIGRDRLAGASVVDVCLPGLAAGDEEQIVTTVEGHAERVATIGRINELLCSAAAKVTSIDVTGEQLTCIERGSLAFRDALRGVGTAQHNEVGPMF
jgi:hypothetical protein